MVEISVLEDSTVDDSAVEVALVNVSVVPVLVKVTKVELDTSVEAVVVPVDDVTKLSDEVSEEEASTVELDVSVKDVVVPVEVSVDDATNDSKELKDDSDEVAVKVELEVREALGIQGPAFAPMALKATNVTTRDLKTSFHSPHIICPRTLPLYPC